jgi:hypothetical protein
MKLPEVNRIVFSLFQSRRKGHAEVVSGEKDFFHRLENVAPDRSIFDAQGGEHGNIDLRLVEKIERLLVPLLGNWEQTDRWWHQMDYLGDGVRSLVFRRDLFPRSELPALQAILTGEHSEFTILCTVADALIDDETIPKSKRTDDYLAIFKDKMLITRALANDLSMDA